MVSVKRVRNLGVCCASVVTACYEEVVGGGVCMVGDAYLVGAVCCDPFPVVHWNGRSGGVEDERGASVVARADVYVCERRGCGQGSHLDVVFGVGGLQRGYNKFRVSSPSGETQRSPLGH